jgi:hypothetical protein
VKLVLPKVLLDILTVLVKVVWCTEDNELWPCIVYEDISIAVQVVACVLDYVQLDSPSCCGACGKLAENKLMFFGF